MDKSNQPENINFRQKAEELMGKEERESIALLTEQGTYKLVHELQVHQIELQLQNDELIQAREQTKAASEKYIELYDFAPSGYFTLSKVGGILELNLAGSQMLGKERLLLKNRRFGEIVSKETRPIFNFFLDRVFNGQARETCEVSLQVNGKFPLHVHLTGIANENREQCLLTVVDITQRMKAEDETKVQLKNFYSVFDSSPVAMLVINSATNIVMANLAAVKLSGSNLSKILHHRHGEALGCIQSIKDPRGCGYSKECKLCDVRNGIEDLISSGGSIHGVELEFNLWRNEKTESVWMNVGVEPLLINGTTHWCVALDDITDRKRAQELLLWSEKRMEDIISSLADWVWEVDEKGIYTYSSLKGNEILGFQNDEIIGKTPFDFMVPDEVPRIKEFFNEVYNKKQNIKDLENWVITKDGRKICFLTNGIPKLDRDGNIRGYIGVDKDITERKNAELLLKEAHEHSSAIIRTSPEAIVVTDANGYVSLWNKSAERMFGWTQEEVLGKKNMVDPLDRIAQMQQYRSIVFSGKSLQNIETECIHKNGSILTVNFSASPLHDGLGNIVGILFVSEDITKNKKMLTDLIRAKEHAEESDRLKSAFLANMSHEIRTPMNGILGFTELLKEPDLQSEKQQHYISIIQKSGARMLNIINDIINISKIESGQMSIALSETNINEQVEYIFTFFRPEVEKKGMQIHFKNALSAREAIIHTDREKIYAILTNLVKNAIKFSNEGFIEVGYDLVENQQVAFLQFHVKDTGIGIPKNQQKAIFKRFIQVDVFDKMAKQGAGLGLAISKAYVELLGGKIWVESREQVGSTFYFTIPYHPELKVPIHSKNIFSTKISEQPTGQLKVLIVEDDEFSEMLLTLESRFFSSEILIARKGNEAVETCRNNPDLDLVLMDIEMPEMNGYEATRQIREFNKGIIIIAQTAYALNGDNDKALAAGCNNYITKPIQRGALRKMVFHYFKK
jgi:PAS domain S-box-containing protein